MKIRNGFVSNSSSSSFICDVCGTCESGMDASAHDFDMETCCNGHTFCNSHAENLSKPTPESLRETIKNLIEGKTWLNAERKESLYKELENVPEDELEEFFNDNYGDYGVAESQCPVCSFTSLNPFDGFSYMKKKFSMSDEEILEAIKIHFKSYSEFSDFLSNKK